MIKYIRRSVALCALLTFIVGSICIGDDLRTEPISASNPRLSSEQVSSLATAELVRNRVRVDRFKPRPPTYNADQKNWWVFFIQNKAPFIVDGDLLVVVDDGTGKSCMEYAIDLGPCS
jgi:hypothetical protein